jgi:hypothetical protein
MIVLPVHGLYFADDVVLARDDQGSVCPVGVEVVVVVSRGFGEAAVSLCYFLPFLLPLVSVDPDQALPLLSATAILALPGVDGE